MQESNIYEDAYARATEALERDNPRSWRWDDDGDELAGIFLGYDEGKTKDGDAVRIARIRRSDGVRSLWLFDSPKMLKDEFTEKDPTVGSFLLIRRYPKKQTQDGERSYIPFVVAVVAVSEGDVSPSLEAEAITAAALEAEGGIHEPPMGSSSRGNSER